jgi:hypothetical protein
LRKEITVSIIEESSSASVPAVQGLGNSTNPTTGGVGVYGCVGLPDAGLKGAPPLNNVGVYGSTVALTTQDSIGVYGASENGIAIYGYSANGVAIQGETQIADAVNGLCHSNQHAGVAAHNDGGGSGLWAIGTPAGYFAGDVQITGNIGVSNLSASGSVSVATNASIAGSMTVNGDHHCLGTMYAKLDVVLGSDCAEDFDITPNAGVEPGTVMVLSDNGALRASHDPYDKRVAGVISGAGDYRPGMILGRSESPLDRMPLGLVGKVYCKVDTKNAAIEIGDLLTTSGTPGHAMKAEDSARAFGAVIGKALRNVSAGEKALIPILIALQ